MKKSLCLIATMLSVLAFAGTAHAFLEGAQHYQDQLLLPYEGGGGGGTIIGNSCASTCGGANTQSACQAGGYVCTSSGGCWCPTSTPLGSIITPGDLGNHQVITNPPSVVQSGGSGSGSTKKVSGDCPAGTTLSGDQCCCITN